MCVRVFVCERESEREIGRGETGVGGGVGGFRVRGLVLEYMSTGSVEVGDLFGSPTLISSPLVRRDRNIQRGDCALLPVTGFDLLRAPLFSGTAAGRSGAGTYSDDTFLASVDE